MDPCTHVASHMNHYTHTFDYLSTIGGVSKNHGTPKSSILIGFYITNHTFWVLLFLETSIFVTFLSAPPLFLTILTMLGDKLSMEWVETESSTRKNMAMTSSPSCDAGEQRHRPTCNRRDGTCHGMGRYSWLYMYGFYGIGAVKF